MLLVLNTKKMTNKDILFSLQDNNYYGYTLDGEDDYDKSLLRTLSSNTINDLSAKGLLVFPQSFNLGDGNSHVLSFYEDEYEGKNMLFTNNMLGFIGHKNTEIRIRSRFSDSDNDNFIHYMLLRIEGLNLFDLPTGYKFNRENIYNLLFYLFPKMLKEAISSGLLKMYVYNSYNDSHLNGQIDVPRHIRLNKPATGKAAYNVREYSFDNPVTELIRHCIEYMGQSWIGRKILKIDKETHIYVQTIKDVTPSFNRGDLRQILMKNKRTIIHPLYKNYAKLQKLCIEILKHKKVKYETNDNKIHGLLVDGAWLWEEYVAKVLEGRMCHFVLNSGRKFWLFNDDSDNIQRIVPDYLSTEKHIVGDAKYIPLDSINNKELSNEERATGIYYKTLMYMLRFSADTGFLFYPGNNHKHYSDYKVIDTNKHLIKLGIKISHAKEFKTFWKEMASNESEFITLYDLITNNK